MVKIVFWSNILPKIGSYITKVPTACINLGVGIFCGAAQAVGISIFTKDSVNEAFYYLI